MSVSPLHIIQRPVVKSLTFCAIGFLCFISENIIYWFPQPYSYVAFLVQDMTFSVIIIKELQVFKYQEMFENARFIFANLRQIVEVCKFARCLELIYANSLALILSKSA